MPCSGMGLWVVPAKDPALVPKKTGWRHFKTINRNHLTEKNKKSPEQGSFFIFILLQNKVFRLKKIDVKPVK
jgi:hypothetical protein